ncbi:sensor histidine kinase [Pedobacter steynii]
MQSKKEQIDALAELNEELENYFSNTIIPQLFVDARLILRKFTIPAMKQFHLSQGHVGQPLEKIKENFGYPGLMDHIRKVNTTGKILEKEIQTTDMHWYQMNILPYLISKENKVDGVIITFVDITSRIRELKDHEKLIADHELLLDTIAHDIKNPLIALDLGIAMLKKDAGKKEEQFPLLLTNLDNSLKRLRKVVNDLVASRWQEHRYQATLEVLDLKHILEDVKLTLAPQILESKAIIREDIEVSRITFTRRKLRSLIYNLISNALKYVPAERNPEVLIKSYWESDYVVISIADNGIGMSAKDQQSIFEKFRRIRPLGEGSGVGLYLVNTIVVASGGKITIESKPDEGSVFRVFLKPEPPLPGETPDITEK